ncbi:MAG TPA: 3-hydroxyacyl-CoA dehydrogenase NAD-binding domain-containing protein [Thermomicrobiales bacterium]|nr:3-hydroxyacyl-CoA dehydrogenase NAD-binding domain-containing protein [Thermomicrobiales bacterium]
MDGKQTTEQDEQPRVRRALVVGAGTMGRGIAQVIAEAGIATSLYDVDAAGLERGLDAIDQQWRNAVTKGRRTDADIELFRANLSPADSVAPAADVDLALEAIFEQPDAKLAVVREVTASLPAGALFASNTSSISITRLAAAAADPSRVIGLHFFNPVPVLPLVEVVRGMQTSDETVERGIAFVRQIGKDPALVQDSPGFVVNRILLPMINDAIFCLAEGVATAETIDATMKLGANHPMGPLALADLIGLDVCLDILETLQRDFGDDKYRPAPLLRRMVAAGKLGRKRGAGFYDYA